MSEQFEAQLTLKDRLNFPYLLANQILTFQRSILNLEFSEREIRESIESFVHLIPDAWKDDKFTKELDEASINKQIDVRPSFCGVKPSVDYCQENGIPFFREQKTFNHYKMFSACINLLNRRAMLAKVNPVQELLEIDFDDFEQSEVGKSNIQKE